MLMGTRIFAEHFQGRIFGKNIEDVRLVSHRIPYSDGFINDMGYYICDAEVFAFLKSFFLRLH